MQVHPTACGARLIMASSVVMGSYTVAFIGTTGSWRHLSWLADAALMASLRLDCVFGRSPYARGFVRRLAESDAELSIVFLLLMYGLRVYIAQGWYIITYGLAIYLLNLFLGFLSPAQDPELEGSGPLLPVKDGEHMFIRRVPEFKFW